MKMVFNKINKLASYATCVAALPFVLMLYQYQRNIQYLSLSQVLIFSCVVSIILLLIYFTTRFSIRTDVGAFLFTLAIFFLFFMWGPYRYLLRELRPLINSIVASPILIIITLTVLSLTIVTIVILITKSERVKTFLASIIPIYKKERKIYIITAVIMSANLIYAFYEIRISNMSTSTTLIFTIFIGAIILFCAFLYPLCRYLKDNSKSKTALFVLLIMMGVLLLQNIVVITMFASQQQSDELFYKDEFVITQPKAQQPNIYWFHTDGMLGFDAMSRFFGENLSEFAQELENRGFWINHEASFDGQFSTQYAIPALMSPFFYDRVMSWALDPEYAISNPNNADLFAKPELRLTLNFTNLRIARERNETIMAFNYAGFNTSSIQAGFDMYYFPTVNQFYSLRSPESPLFTATSIPESIKLVNSITNLQNLFDLLSKISPIPDSSSHRFNVQNNITALLLPRVFANTQINHDVDLFKDMDITDSARKNLEKYNLKANCLHDTFWRSEPRFTLITMMTWHRVNNWPWDEHGNYNPYNTRNDIEPYPGNYIFGGRLLIIFIDFILEHDPNAVIVLQADHGLHLTLKDLGIEGIMNIFSCTAEEAIAISHSVMSAIRLPEGYLTPETEKILSDPRNISRYLINTFVGQNYDYIPYQFRQVFRGP